jgi:hypothetical protein
MTPSLIKGAARTRYLLDLLSQVPDPRKRRGRRHALAGLLGPGGRVGLPARVRPGQRGHLDQVLGAWLFTRPVQAAGRLVTAVGGKAVRGAKGKSGKAPHLAAALARGIGAVLGQVAADAKSNEIPAVRELLKAFAGLAGAVVTIDALCGRRHKCQYSSKSPFAITALKVRTASAPSRPHLQPPRLRRSAMRWRQAPSITPVAIGQPAFRAWS